MQTFKVGDKVVCTNDHDAPHLQNGTEYIISCISYDGRLVGLSLAGPSGVGFVDVYPSWHCSRFELVKTTAQSFDAKLDAEQERQHAIDPTADKGWKPDRGINWEAHKGFMKAL